MKLFKNLVNAVALVLQDIFKEKRYADKALESAFKKNAQWGSRDRRFIAEAVYDIVRYFRLYSTLAETTTNFWFITGVWLAVKGEEIPNWPEFKHIDVAQIQRRFDALQKDFAVAESIPHWLLKLGTDELGEEIWTRELKAMNQQASVFLRVNTLKSSKEKTLKALIEDKIDATDVKGSPQALCLSKRSNIFQHKLFKEGWFEVQDAGSQMISEFLDPQPGETVIDACAGAGGKSLHLAALMKNKGKIISMDVEEWKLQELKKRARRAGAFNVETKHIDGKESIAQLKGKADRLLLDVPCSGLGVLKRNPDAKWKLSKEIIEKTKSIQALILRDYPSMLRKGGILVYSTCSLLPSENHDQVKQFLSENSNFTLLKEKTLLPSEGFDGFYMAMMRREA